jgi:hypothetical protein
MNNKANPDRSGSPAAVFTQARRGVNGFPFDDHQVFVIFASFCADPFWSDGRKIFAQKIAKITKI